MSLTTEEVDICNQSLYKIGANAFTFADQAGVQALRCIAHYAQTRDALLRSYWWRMARARAVLAQDTNDPDFEWDNQFKLPEDFLRLRSVYEESGTTSKSRRHALEGQRFLTNLSAVSIRYVAKITDTTKFDPLFIEILILLLAQKLLGPLAGGGSKLGKEIRDDLKKLTPKAQAVDMDETDTGGRSDWNLARHGGIGIEGSDERFW